MTQIRSGGPRSPRPLGERVGVRGVLVGLLLAVLGQFVGCKKNHAPDAPAVSIGTSAGVINGTCTFRSVSEDPDGDSVAIRLDWGDGDTSAWSAFVPSGDTVAASHVWSSAGTYCVRAQARDKEGAGSDWTSGLGVVITRGGTRTFGGMYDDRGYSVQQTQDCGYIVAGSTSSYGEGSGDVWLVKTDAAGHVTWGRNFGGAGTAWGHSVQQTRDGGYIVAGTTWPFGGSFYDVWLLKTDASGDTIWTRTFGGANYDEGYSVQQTRDGGYIITGVIDSPGEGRFDVLLVKTDGTGNEVWSRTFGGAQNDYGHSVQQTRDGGYIVAGGTGSYGAGSADVWLIKTDANGDTVWTRTYGGVEHEDGRSVQQTQDGGYIIAGQTCSYGAGDGDLWLVKTDAKGDTVWTGTFGGTKLDWGSSAQQTQEGGYIVAGTTGSYGAGDDVWLVKTDANGGMVWSRTFGGANLDWGNSVQQTQDGGYITVGYSGAGAYDVLLIKTDAEGMVEGSTK
jgi:hypothetical protein